jgi:endo-1,3-1,4-beta-glycanase ExoK
MFRWRKQLRPSRGALAGAGGLCSVMAVLFAYPSPRSWSADGPGTSFFDDFATFDLTRWSFSDGWNSGDFQDCTYSRKGLKPIDGALELTLSDTPTGKTPYTCAEIQTKAEFGYGTYEVKMRAAPGAGSVSAFFVYAGPNPQDEIDFEFLGKDLRAVQLNYYAGGKGGHEYLARMPVDPSKTPVLLAFDWLPDTIRWYIDGQLVHEVKRQAGEPFPERPTRIHLSIWNGKASKDNDAWLGRFQYDGKPLLMTVDHVAFTAQGEACQFPESVVCSGGIR